MSGRSSDAGSYLATRAERTVITEVRIVVYDRGPEPEWNRDRRLFGPWLRYEAELENDPRPTTSGCLRGRRVHRLISNHRPVLERRWSGGAGA